MPNVSNENTMTVDIRLCGNIPRHEMNALFGAPYPATALTSHTDRLSTTCLAETNGPTPCSTQSDQTLATTNSINMLQAVDKQFPLAPVLEPPAWAVPARSETRLEPVCETSGLQSSIDLTTKSAFRIGRSPNCDVQLMHATSSRRHAMVFHHSNGSCYVIDCGSAHGTFVNGRRIASPSATGVVVPHKVRRGAIVRFGGPGAPCFILKSLPSHLSNVECLANADCKQFQVSDEAMLVLRNTRLNALGTSSVDVCVREPPIKSFCLPPSKRPFEPSSVCSASDCDDDSINGPDCKRMRCSSPPLSPEEPLRLVSPDLPAMTKPRRVTFAVEDAYFYPASITPDESSEEDNV